MAARAVRHLRAALRALGGRREVERFLADQDASLELPALVRARGAGGPRRRLTRS